MEDVISGGRNRGQLILITGLVIAITMVAMVLILNSAIYTENVATRGVDSGGDDAIDFRNTVIEGSEEIIEHENESDQVDAIDEYTDLVERHYIENAKIAEADPNETDGEIKIDLRYQTPELLYKETVSLGDP